MRYEIDNSAESAVDSKHWDPDKTKIIKQLKGAENADELFEEMFLVAPDEPGKANTVTCKYPHHVLKSGKMVLSAKGVQAAYARAKQQGIYEGEVKKHLDGHREELGMTESGKLQEERALEEADRALKLVLEAAEELRRKHHPPVVRMEENAFTAMMEKPQVNPSQGGTPLGQPGGDPGMQQQQPVNDPNAQQGVTIPVQNVDPTEDTLTNNPIEGPDDRDQDNLDGENRKEMYQKFADVMKQQNPGCVFSTIFDEDIFRSEYKIVPYEMRYFYRLQDPVNVETDELKFIPFGPELLEAQEKHDLGKKLFVFATHSDKPIFFNQLDKTIWDNETKITDSFDQFIEILTQNNGILPEVDEDGNPEAQVDYIQDPGANGGIDQPTNPMAADPNAGGAPLDLGGQDQSNQSFGGFPWTPGVPGMDPTMPMSTGLTPGVPMGTPGFPATSAPANDQAPIDLTAQPGMQQPVTPQPQMASVAFTEGKFSQKAAEVAGRVTGIGDIKDGIADLDLAKEFRDKHNDPAMAVALDEYGKKHIQTGVTKTALELGLLGAGAYGLYKHNQKKKKQELDDAGSVTTSENEEPSEDDAVFQSEDVYDVLQAYGDLPDIPPITTSDVVKDILGSVTGAGDIANAVHHVKGSRDYAKKAKEEPDEPVHSQNAKTMLKWAAKDVAKGTAKAAALAGGAYALHKHNQKKKQKKEAEKADTDAEVDIDELVEAAMTEGVAFPNDEVDKKNREAAERMKKRAQGDYMAEGGSFSGASDDQCKSLTSSTIDDDYFDEASHGSLKHDHSIGIDAKTGHMVHIVYDLDGIEITKNFMPDGKEVTSDGSMAGKGLSTKDEIPVLKRYGNTSHQSKNQRVKSIIDMTTGEKLKEASLKDYFHIDKYLNRDNARVIHIKVGEIDREPRMKTTHWSNNPRDISDMGVGWHFDRTRGTDARRSDKVRISKEYVKYQIKASKEVADNAKRFLKMDHDERRRVMIDIDHVRNNIKSNPDQYTDQYIHDFLVKHCLSIKDRHEYDEAFNSKNRSAMLRSLDKFYHHTSTIVHDAASDQCLKGVIDNCNYDIENWQKRMDEIKTTGLKPDQIENGKPKKGPKQKPEKHDPADHETGDQKSSTSSADSSKKASSSTKKKIAVAAGVAAAGAAVAGGAYALHKHNQKKKQKKEAEKEESDDVDDLIEAVMSEGSDGLFTEAKIVKDENGLEWRYKTPVSNPKFFSEYGVKIPKDLQEFIIKHHAATPNKHCFMVGKTERVFGSVLSLSKDADDDIYTAINTVNNRDLFPFAVDPYGNYICYNFGTNRIDFWDHETSTVTTTGKTLHKFLDSLYDSEKNEDVDDLPPIDLTVFAEDVVQLPQPGQQLNTGLSPVQQQPQQSQQQSPQPGNVQQSPQQQQNPQQMTDESQIRQYLVNSKQDKKPVNLVRINSLGSLQRADIMYEDLGLFATPRTSTPTTPSNMLMAASVDPMVENASAILSNLTSWQNMIAPAAFAIIFANKANNLHNMGAITETLSKQYKIPIIAATRRDGIYSEVKDNALMQPVRFKDIEKLVRQKKNINFDGDSNATDVSFVVVYDLEFGLKVYRKQPNAFEQIIRHEIGHAMTWRDFSPTDHSEYTIRRLMFDAIDKLTPTSRVDRNMIYHQLRQEKAADQWGGVDTVSLMELISHGKLSPNWQEHPMYKSLSIPIPTELLQMGVTIMNHGQFDPLAFKSKFIFWGSQALMSIYGDTKSFNQIKIAVSSVI